MYKKYIKRILDIGLSIIGLIVLSPIIAIIAILVRFKLGSPVVFKHQRPGKNEKLFYLYKFRTMTNERDENGKLLPDKERITKFGTCLRELSLDELLEMVNIIKGDMSIVGPRPLEVYFLPLYNSKQKRRHSVYPGLTGLAQVNGRNRITWKKRFEYDVYYVDNISFWLDLKIIFLTIIKVLKRSDISEEGMVSCEDFTGDEKSKSNQ